MKLYQKSFLISAALLGSAVLSAIPIVTAQAAGPIVLDGNFSDWDGQAHVSDPPGDAQNDKTDIIDFYFATNPDDETAYFMAERLDGGPTAVTYFLLIDADDDGNFTEAADRRIVIDYDPQNNRSSVRIQVYAGDGTFLQTIVNNADWGESQQEGGYRVEWGVSFADLGIVPYQTISIQLESRQSNHASDATAVAQWSPANLLGPGLLLVILVAAAGWMAYRRKKLI